MKEDQISKVMREMGSRGGKRRLETMTAAQRSAVAKKAAAASVKARKKKAKLAPKGE